MKQKLTYFPPGDRTISFLAKSELTQYEKKWDPTRGVLWSLIRINGSQHIYIWVKSCRTEKKCLKCPKLPFTPRVALSKPSILQTWVFYPAGDLHKNFQLPGMPRNVCRKGLKFPEIPGNLNW